VEIGLRGDGDAHVGLTDRQGQERLVASVTKKGKGTLWIDQGEAGDQAARPSDEVDRFLGAMRRWMGRR